MLEAAAVEDIAQGPLDRAAIAEINQDEIAIGGEVGDRLPQIGKEVIAHGIRQGGDIRSAQEIGESLGEALAVTDAVRTSCEIAVDRRQIELQESLDRGFIDG